MSSKAAAKDKRRRTTMVPVTTMEEVPVLSARERAQLLASLEAAEARVKAGKGIEETHIVDILSFWNAARDPDTLEL